MEKLLYNRYDKSLIPQLPRVVFQGRIVVVQSAGEAERAVDYLLSCDLLGIDSETRPSFRRGENHKVSLLQVSTRDICFLFRLNMTGLTPSLLRLLEDKGRFESITVMVQKEVAERICAGPGSKEYGALSLAVQYYSSPRVVLKVPPACFMPRPAVESSVLHLQAYEEPALIRASFNQRRKTLANGLSHGFRCRDRVLTRGEAEAALEALGLPQDIRGEKLSLEQFAALSRELEKR